MANKAINECPFFQTTIWCSPELFSKLTAPVLILVLLRGFYRETSVLHQICSKILHNAYARLEIAYRWNRNKYLERRTLRSFTVGYFVQFWSRNTSKSQLKPPNFFTLINRLCQSTFACFICHFRLTELKKIFKRFTLFFLHCVNVKISLIKKI